VNFIILGASNDDISAGKKVYGIHGEMRRLRLGLNKERRMLVNLRDVRRHYPE